MKGELNKMQHYLPQCYLRGFANEKEITFVYNKQQSKAYPKSISKIACGDFFYRIPEKYISPDQPYDQDFYEKKFFAQGVEPVFNKILIDINNKAKCWQSIIEVLIEEDRVAFASLTSIQYLRLPRIRSSMFDAYKKLTAERGKIWKAMLKKYYPNDESLIDSLDFDYDEDRETVEHSDIYSNEDIIHDFQDQLLNKIWIFKVSQSNVFTSDNPILAKPHLLNQPMLYQGFGTKSAEVIFPLSSSLILCMYDSEYFQSLSSLDNTFIEIGEKETRQYNATQYMLANKELYSLDNDFRVPNMLRQLNDGKEMFMDRNKIV